MALTKVRSGMRTLATDEVVADNIAAGAVGASEIADGTVVAADLAADSVTASEIAAGAVSASEIASTFDISSKTVTLPAAAVTAHVTAFDDSVLSNNVALLAFKLAAGDSLTKFNMVDSVIDDFADSTGIDTGNSTNETVSSGVCRGTAGASKTVLLIHSDTSDSSTTFTDSSTGGSTHTISAAGNTVHSTSNQKIGATSILFDGSDNLTIPDSADFYVTTDYTHEFYYRQAGTTGEDGYAKAGIFGQSGTSSNGNPRNALWRGTTGFYWYDADADKYSDFTVSGTDVEDGAWHHVALTYDLSATTMKLYIDGVAASQTITSYTPSNNSNQMFFGQLQASNGSTGYLHGYLDEIRFTQSLVYSANFTPPTTALGEIYSAADLTLISTTTTAEATATRADLVFLLEEVGTNTLGTDIKAYVSRNGNANYSTALTLVDEGDWGTNKRIITARDVDISGLAGTTAMRYKITTHNTSEGSKEARIHAVSLGWS